MQIWTIERIEVRAMNEGNNRKNKICVSNSTTILSISVRSGIGFYFFQGLREERAESRLGDVALSMKKEGSGFKTGTEEDMLRKINGD